MISYPNHLNYLLPNDAVGLYILKIIEIIEEAELIAKQRKLKV
jgi:hypothetical protein